MSAARKESQLALIVVNPKRDRSRKTMSGEVLFPSLEERPSRSRGTYGRTGRSKKHAFTLKIRMP